MAANNKKRKSAKAAFQSTPSRRLPTRSRGPLSRTLIDKHGKQTLANHLRDKTFKSMDRLKSLRMPEGSSTALILRTLAEAVLATKLIPTESDKGGDINKVEKSQLAEVPTRIGLEMGEHFYRFFRFTEGMKEDAQMRTAKELYKENNIPLFDNQSSTYYDDYDGENYDFLLALNSTCGYNRQGVWYGYPYNVQRALPTSYNALLMSGYTNPVTSKLLMYNNLRSKFIDTGIINWLGETNNQSSDLWYAITGMQDRITIGNGMSFLPVDLKIYICECHSASKYPAQSTWFLPEAPTSFQNFMNPQYVHAQTRTDLKYRGSSETGLYYAESSVLLGATPMFSPKFREHWEIVDVVDQQIMPTDKFTLVLDRVFRHTHSLRDMETQYDQRGSHWWYPGDLNVIITYKGQPCYMKDLTPGTGAQDLFEVQTSPCKITVNARSSYQMAAPEIFDNLTTTNVTTRQNFISGEGRLLDKNLKSADFDQTRWAIDVVTNVSEKTGGPR